MAGSYRLGVDIGGTFTDAILLDEATGALHTAKVATTPGDPSAGFLRVVRRILDEAGVDSRLVEDPPRDAQEPDRGVPRRRRDLGRPQRPGRLVEQDRVGEGAPHVDAEPVARW